MANPTKVKATLRAVTRFADDVFRLDFEVDRKYTRFQPGQFLHLTLETFDPTQAYWPESCVFSICSAPRSTTLSVIFSVKGEYTSRMRDELCSGEEYWLKLPYGDFVIPQLVPPAETAVLVAGGTGVSPFVSYLEDGLSSGFQRQVYLGYAVRSPDRLAFEDLLARLRECDEVTARVWSESMETDSSLVTDTGRLDLSAVVEDTRSMPHPNYLLSGPPGMLGAFSRELQTKYGVDSARIHIDEWE